MGNAFEGGAKDRASTEKASTAEASKNLFGLLKPDLERAKEAVKRLAIWK